MLNVCVLSRHLSPIVEICYMLYNCVCLSRYISPEILIILAGMCVWVCACVRACARARLIINLRQHCLGGGGGVKFRIFISDRRWIPRRGLKILKHSFVHRSRD